MRVLWFTNRSLLPVTRKLQTPDIVQGGWMDSLRSALQDYPDLELGIASPSDFDYHVFEEGRTKFYNIQSPSNHGNFGSVIRRWHSSIDFRNGLDQCHDVIERFKPDLIHLHGSESFFGTLANETSVPTVISIQGILTICELFFFGGLTISERFKDLFTIDFIRGVDIYHQYMYMKKSAIRERQILRSCKYFIGRTEFDKNIATLFNAKSFYHHCDEILRPPFYTGLWTPDYSRDKFVIYCTSSGPAPYKGLDCLLNTCHILKTNGFQNFQLRIAGQIQYSSLWNILTKRIKLLGLIENVTWLGRCSAEQIVSELSSANVFVLPSYIENSPNSLAEAMIVGTPCIASSVGGVPSMVTNGEDGLLFPSGDPYSLAGLIEKIYREPELAKSLSKNSRITARNRHNPQKIAREMMSIYSEIIGVH